MYLQPYPHTTGTTSRALLLLLVHGGLRAPDPAGPPGGDETDLLTGRAATANCGGLANVLVVTTTMGMLHGVHGHTTHLETLNALDLSNYRKLTNKSRIKGFGF